MRKFLMVAALVAASLFWGGAAHACNVPNPNLNAPPFIDGCPVPASALNKLQAQLWFNVQAYGAKGDSSTDDSAAIAAAFTACSTAGGGQVYFPPTGNAYKIAQANLITTANTGACSWRAFAGHYWPSNFYDNTLSDWTKQGAWIWCTDTSHACANVTTGGGVQGLNFWQTQPTPSSTTCSVTPCPFGTGWTPTTYPAIVSAIGVSHFQISDNQIVNAYQCLDIEGPTSGVGNFMSKIEHNMLGCFNLDAYLTKIDNNLLWNDNHEFLLWFQGSTQVLGYDETQGIGLKIQYWANPYIANSDLTWRGIGWEFLDGTVTNGFGSLTFASADMQVNNVQFNEVCQAVVATGSTHLAGGAAGDAVGANIWTNVFATADSQTSGTPSGGNPQCNQGQNILNLGSDNVSLIINGLNIGFTDGIAVIGNGTNGFLQVTSGRGQEYAEYTSGTAAFTAKAGAVLSLPNQLFSYNPNTGAGPEIATTGIMMPFDIPKQLNMTAQTASGETQTVYCYLPTTGNLGTNFGCTPLFATRVQTGQFNIDYYSGGVYSTTPLVIDTNGVGHFNTTWTLTGLSGASTASKYVCVDSAGLMLTQTSAC